MRSGLAQKLAWISVIPAIYGLAIAGVEYLLLRSAGVNTEPLASWIMVGALLGTVGVASLVWILSRQLLGEVEQIRQTVRDFGSAHALPPVVNNGSSDELSLVNAEIRQMLESLDSKQANRDAGHAEKRRLAAIIGHDIKTPLTSTAMFLEMMVGGTYGELDDNLKRNVRSAAVEIARLVSLTQNLIDMDRSQFGALRLEKATAKVSTIITRSRDAVRLYAEQSNVEVITDLTDEYVFVDADKIVQVIVNLLSNAIRHSPEQGKVSVVTKFEGRTWRVEVADQGPGVPPEYKASIFEAYKQAEAGRTGNAGLGLFIAKCIIELHQGKIDVDSASGGGARFWFEIPADDPSSILSLSSFDSMSSSQLDPSN